MAIVVASMVVIVITAAAVLLAVFVMHEITTSPRARARLRRWALASGAWAYSMRRQLAYRARLIGRYARRWLGPPASRARQGLKPVVEGSGELAEQLALVLAERARPLIVRVKADIDHRRPLAPPHAARKDIAGRRRTAR